MPTTILIDLLSHTYGATPWNRAHIESEIELIPSPVRLLRAIISGAYRIEIGDSAVLKAMITELSGSQPIYHIPQGTYIAHNTYRKDKASFKGELHKSGKMYSEPYYEYGPDDAFIVVQWDLELGIEQRETLKRCLENIAYLGRSEHIAQWHLLGDGVEVEFNAKPMAGGDCLVLMPTADLAAELWVVPGERNSQMLTNPFSEVQYSVRFSEVGRGRLLLPPVNQMMICADISYDLDPRRTIDWCDVLHKTLCKALPNSEVFRGSTRITMDGRGFCLDGRGFSDDEVAAVAGIRRLWRYDFGGIDVWLERASLVERRRVFELESETPYFMMLAPAVKARKSGTYATKRIAEGAFEKMGVEHQALRELLLKDGWSKAEIGELDWCDRGAGVLAAVRSGVEVGTVEAGEWVECADWHTMRRSGTRGEVFRPARGVAYGLRMTYAVGFEGVVSLGYGANFGLGEMR